MSLNYKLYLIRLRISQRVIHIITITIQNYHIQKQKYSLFPDFKKRQAFKKL